MADKKISELPSLATINDGDQVEVLHTSDNYRGAFSIIKSYIQAAFDLIYVPLSRTLTINGTAHDLSADRSWTVTGGATAFTDLTDVPASYTGEGSKLVSVKATEDGLEFVTAPTGSFTPGDLTDTAGVDGITITGGTDAVNGAGTDISQHVADATHNGYLASSDFNAFSGKQDALTFIDSVTESGGNVSLVGDSASPTASQYYGTDGTSTLGYHDLPASSVSAFTDLSDVPHSYTGESGKIAAVNGTETGLEFIDAPTGGFTRTITTEPDATSITPTTPSDSNVCIQINTQSAGTLTINAPSATAEARGLLLRIKPNAEQTLSWNSIFRSINPVLPLPTSIDAAKTAYIAFAYNNTDSKWDLTASL